MARKDIQVARREQRARGEMPGGQRRAKSFPGKLTARLEERNGRQFYHMEGFATVFERGYPMWDMFGEYTEIMDYSSLNRSLANNPDVAWLVNHRGVTMARTANGTLELSIKPNEEGYHGLRTDAWLNPDRQDVRDIVSAVVDELVDEMSFAFMLLDGTWNDDFTEFRITEADINRGDVSAVNYGANPFTSIQARTVDVLADLERLPAAALGRAEHIVTTRLAAQLRTAAESLSDASRARYERAAANLSRVARATDSPDIDLSDIADWDIVDETGDDDEHESVESVRDQFDSLEAQDKDKPASEPELSHTRGGKPVYLWRTILDQLKENK